MAGQEKSAESPRVIIAGWQRGWGSLLRGVAVLGELEDVHAACSLGRLHFKNESLVLASSLAF